MHKISITLATDDAGAAIEMLENLIGFIESEGVARPFYYADGDGAGEPEGVGYYASKPCGCGAGLMSRAIGESHKEPYGFGGWAAAIAERGAHVELLPSEWIFLNGFKGACERCAPQAELGI